MTIGSIVFVGSWGGIRDRSRRVIRSGIEAACCKGLALCGLRLGVEIDGEWISIILLVQAVKNSVLSAENGFMTVLENRK